VPVRFSSTAHSPYPCLSSQCSETSPCWQSHQEACWGRGRTVFDPERKCKKKEIIVQSKLKAPKCWKLSRWVSRREANTTKTSNNCWQMTNGQQQASNQPIRSMRETTQQTCHSKRLSLTSSPSKFLLSAPCTSMWSCTTAPQPRPSLPKQIRSPRRLSVTK